jgi:hypothetical protein
LSVASGPEPASLREALQRSEHHQCVDVAERRMVERTWQATDDLERSQ